MRYSISTPFRSNVRVALSQMSWIQPPHRTRTLSNGSPPTLPCIPSASQVDAIRSFSGSQSFSYSLHSLSFTGPVPEAAYVVPSGQNGPYAVELGAKSTLWLSLKGQTNLAANPFISHRMPNSFLCPSLPWHPSHSLSSVRITWPRV